jgi:hypothetical protein
MTYQVVEAQTAGQLQESVQALIDEGWEPQGGVAVAIDPHSYAAAPSWYCQAMIRSSA